MIRKILFIVSALIVVGLSSCKSQYELILSSADVQMKYDAAFDYFENKKYSKAVSLFESVSIATRGTKQDDTVQYYIALSNYKMDDIYTADAGFESFINMFPTSPFIPSARYYYIDCLYGQTLRYELDQQPTHKALTMIAEYLKSETDTTYIKRYNDMTNELNERLDRKSYEGARIYYVMEDYRSAVYALKDLLKEKAENIYREEVVYHIALASYKYAFNSMPDKQKGRYLDFVDAYYNFVTEYPDSKYRNELDGLNKRAQKIINPKK